MHVRNEKFIPEARPLRQRGVGFGGPERDLVLLLGVLLLVQPVDQVRELLDNLAGCAR